MTIDVAGSSTGTFSWVRALRLPGFALPIAFALGGCSGRGVLDPQGPVAGAELELYFLYLLGIMLAIVIPTILATLGVPEFGFRRLYMYARDICPTSLTPDGSK